MSLKLNPTTGQFDLVLDKASEIQQTKLTNGIGANTVQQALDAIGTPLVKNYIKFTDAETGTTDGWLLGNVTLTNAFPSGVPAFGSGASANLSITNSSSNPLADTRSYLYASSAATIAGDFLATDVFTINPVDQAKVLTIKLNYQVVTGTVNASGTSSNSFGIAIYDVTAAQWIMPAGVWSMTQTSGVGQATATFQTSATSTQYRLVLFNANATSGAVSLKLDRVSVSPQTAPLGAVVTDWQAYTPIFTGLGTVTNVNIYWRRNGANLELTGRFQNGTTTATEARISLPPGLVSVSNITNPEMTGQYILSTSGTSIGYLLREASVSYITFGIQNATLNAFTKQNGTSLTSSGVVSIQASIPIAGWSSQVQVSDSTDTRVVAFKASKNSGAHTANATEQDVASYNAASFDTHAAFNATTGEYTIPVTGIYEVAANVTFASATVTLGYLSLHKNGSAEAYGAQSAGPSSFSFGLVLTTKVSCNAGDKLKIRAYQNSGGSLNYNTTANATSFSVNRVSGPAVVAATESVNGYYYTVAGPTVNNTVPTITFATKVFDSHNSYSSNTLTVPVSGKYEFKMFAQSASTAWTGGTGLQVLLTTGGTTYLVGSARAATAFTGALEVNGALTLSLNAGDTVTFQVSSDVSTTLATVAHRQRIQWSRIGN